MKKILLYVSMFALCVPMVCEAVERVPVTRQERSEAMEIHVDKDGKLFSYDKDGKPVYIKNDTTLLYLYYGDRGAAFLGRDSVAAERVAPKTFVSAFCAWAGIQNPETIDVKMLDVPALPKDFVVAVKESAAERFLEHLDPDRVSLIKAREVFSAVLEECLYLMYIAAKQRFLGMKTVHRAHVASCINATAVSALNRLLLTHPLQLGIRELEYLEVMRRKFVEDRAFRIKLCDALTTEIVREFRKREEDASETSVRDLACFMICHARIVY